MPNSRMIRVTLHDKTGYGLTASSLRELDNAIIQRAFDKGYPVETALDDGVMDFSDIDGLDETGERE